MSVVEKLKQFRGTHIGDGINPPIKTADVIAALESQRLNDSTLQDIKSTIVSLECVVDWIKNGCTRGPEAEEVRLNVERLQRLFPEAERFNPKFGP